MPDQVDIYEAPTANELCGKVNNLLRKADFGVEIVSTSYVVSEGVHRAFLVLRTDNVENLTRSFYSAGG